MGSVETGDTEPENSRYFGLSSENRDTEPESKGL